jgi:hypothetical protein
VSPAIDDDRDTGGRYVERTIRECLEARLLRRQAPYRVVPAEELRVPLEAWLREELGPDVTIGELTRAPGGASKENFFFELGTRRALLLRLDPGESIVETDRRREFEVLRAVANDASSDVDGKRLRCPAEHFDPR